MPESATGSTFRRRPIVAGDEAFLRALESDRWGSAGEDPLADVQFRARQQQYCSQFPDAEDFVVLVGDEPAGRLLIASRPAAHNVVDVALLARFRGRGIGTALMREVQATAAAAGVPVELTVLAGDGRLVAWYRRLGFAPAASGPLHLRMVWSPSHGR